MQRLVVPEVMARLRVLRVLLLPMAQEEMAATVAVVAALAALDMPRFLGMTAASAYLQVKAAEAEAPVAPALLEAKAQTDVQSCTSANLMYCRTELLWIRKADLRLTAQAV